MNAIIAASFHNRSGNRAMHPSRKGHGLGRSRTPLDEGVVIRFAGELDAGQPAWCDVLLRAIKGDTSRFIIDMIDVSFIDSSVVDALLLAERATTEVGGWLRLVFTPHVIGRVIEICGLAAVLPQYPTLEAARRGAMRPSPAAAPGTGDEGPPQ